MQREGPTPSTAGTTCDFSIIYGQNADSGRLFELAKPYEFGEEYDFPQWGNFTYSSSPLRANNFSFQSGFSATLRYNYVMQHYLADKVDSNYRGSGSQEPVFAFAHDFGEVSAASVLYTIGSVQQPVIRYLTSTGLEGLQPWWTQCYGDIFQMIAYHYNDYTATQTLAFDFEAQLKADIDSYYSANMAMVYSNSTPTSPIMYSNGSQGYADGTDQFGNQYIFDPNTAYGFLNPTNFSGIAIPDISESEAYYSIVALSARQVMGAYVLAVPPASGCTNNTFNTSEPLMFQKEISSDGNVNTVDVMYPAMPFFLYANPELLKYNLEPLLQNQEGNFYPNGYSMHDLGTNYPNATGHVEGNDEYMPVEESGNMVLMAYAYYKFSSNTAWLISHYPILSQWAGYLIQYSLIPGIQLSTDDFAGELVNQTNLAIKGIVGIQAMSAVARIAGAASDAANYSDTASAYFKQWEYFGIDPSGRHTLLSYEWRSSYGLLYNTFPDKLLNLGIIPPSLYAMQSDWYPTISQVFGVPLDNRHSYTKSDWEMWTAATCAPETRRLFVNGLAYWLNYTSTDRAFTDLYETIDDGSYPVSPSPIYFIARPVAGGHFSLLALLRAGENSETGTGDSGSSFPVNATTPLAAGTELPSQASVDLGPVATGSETVAPGLTVVSGTAVASLGAHNVSFTTITTTFAVLTTTASSAGVSAGGGSVLPQSVQSGANPSSGAVAASVR